MRFLKLCVLGMSLCLLVSACTRTAPVSDEQLADTILEDRETSTGPVDRGELGMQGKLFSQLATPDAHIDGMWSPAANWPMNAIHAALLPSGDVLTYGLNVPGTGHYYYDVWEPDNGLGDDAHTTLNRTTPTNIFCSAQALLPGSGDMLITGGTQRIDGVPNLGVYDVNVVDYADNSLERSPLSMLKGRWYPTAMILPNGELLVHGGRDEARNPVLIPEIYNPDTGWRLLNGADGSPYSGGGWSYPRSFVAPNGKVFMMNAGSKQLRYLDTTGNGLMLSAGQLPSAINNRSPAVMFDVGKILAFRGNKNASIIDINGAAPVVVATSSLNENRHWADGTVLANGEVLVSGGASVNQSLDDAVYYAEIWNPDTGQWRVGASAAKARLYHSTALLLPNGAVLTAGGGQPGPVTNLNAEVYYPSYLFKQDGSGEFAERPVLSGVGGVYYNRSFSADFSNAANISRVTLVRAGSVTHSFDMGQRFMELSFTRSGNSLTIEGPSGREIAPPGFYMLFAFSEEGVPSEAQMIAINSSGPPIVNSPGNQSHEENETVGLNISATDPDGDPLSFSASGLPSGLSINAQTGLISGTVADGAEGNYVVTITVSAGGQSSQISFDWIVLPEPVSCGGLAQEAEAAELFGDFALISDAGASGGKAIEVPTSAPGYGFYRGINEAHRAEYCVTVETAGVYRISTEVKAPSSGNDSFYVVIDGLPEEGYIWDTRKGTSYVSDYVSDRGVSGPVEVTLAAGEHSLIFYEREQGTRLDKFELELVSADPTSCGGLSQEAEEGSLFGSFELGSDAAASGGKFVQAAPGSGFRWQGPSNDKAVYCAAVERAGRYQIKAYVHAANTSDDSFFVTVDNSPTSGYLWDTYLNTSYASDYVADRSNQDPVEVNLTAGEHIITFHQREDGTRLDRFELIRVGN